MPICIKHRLNFEGDECPECRPPVVNLSYISDDPAHVSNYTLDNIKKLNAAIEKLRLLNIKINKAIEEKE